MIKVSVIYGTRPEAIKCAPLILKLRESSKFHVSAISTGQHADLNKSIEEFFGTQPDYNLKISSAGLSLNHFVSKAIVSVGDWLEENESHLVVVQGDTSTAFASALASFHRGVPVAHLEAGLRTFDNKSPFPEEANRAMISRIADFHFAPSGLAASHLVKEGVPPSSVFVTGNTGIDALRLASGKRDFDGGSRANARLRFLVTMHRRENLGEPMQNALEAIRDFALTHSDVNFVFPMHPNPLVRSVALSTLSGLKNVELTDPFDYPNLVSELGQCDVVLTDSGGIQEEAPFLGKRVLVLRDDTERPEVLETGLVSLIGTDRERVSRALEESLDDVTLGRSGYQGIYPLGDGYASEKIITILERELS